MFSHYRLTHMEEFIEHTYKKIGITEPSQITIDKIASRLNIWTYFKPFRSKAIERKPGMYTMIIDNRLPIIEQKLEFFHELGHLLRHAGNQTTMPKLFTIAQENDADQFVLYASMPYFLISRLQLPSARADAVNYIAKVFGVPITLAKKRFDQILRREFEGNLTASLKKRQGQAGPAVLSSIFEKEGDELPKCSIFAYYDPSGEYDAPTQLIVKINAQKHFTDNRVPIDLNERFKRIESEDHASLTGVPVLPADLRIIDGIPNLMLPSIAFRYGRAANRFIVQMKHIEEIMRFEKSF